MRRAAEAPGAWSLRSHAAACGVAALAGRGRFAPGRFVKTAKIRRDGTIIRVIP